MFVINDKDRGAMQLACAGHEYSLVLGLSMVLANNHQVLLIGTLTLAAADTGCGFADSTIAAALSCCGLATPRFTPLLYCRCLESNPAFAFAPCTGFQGKISGRALPETELRATDLLRGKANLITCHFCGNSS